MWGKCKNHKSQKSHPPLHPSDCENMWMSFNIRAREAMTYDRDLSTEKVDELIWLSQILALILYTITTSPLKMQYMTRTGYVLDIR